MRCKVCGFEATTGVEALAHRVRVARSKKHGPVVWDDE